LTIVLVSDAEQGGAAYHILAMADAFTRLGFKVSIIFPSGVSTTVLEDKRCVNSVVIPAVYLRGLKAFSYAYRIHKYCKAITGNDVEAIQFSNISGLLYYAMKDSVRVPCLAKVHCFDFLKPTIGVNYPSPRSLALSLSTSIFSKNVTKLCYNLAPHVVAISNFVKEELKKLGVCDQRVSTIYNGVDHEMFSPEINGARIRKKLNNPKYLILAANSFSYSKGAYHLVQAITEVAKEIKEVKLCFVGGYSEILRRNLSEFIRIRGLEKYVSIVNFVPNSEIPNYYAASDICVVPSMQEAFGNVALEAMASGKPVIASKTGGLPEIVSAETGLLVPPGNSSLIAEAIIKLLKDQDLRLKLGEKSFEASKKFSWENTAKETLKLVERQH